MKEFDHNPYTGSSVNQAAFRTGLVIDCNPSTYTATVYIDEGERLYDVPVMGQYGAMHDDDISWTSNLRGSKVLLVFIENQYHILDTLAQRAAGKSTSYGTGVGIPGSGGEDPLTYGALNEIDYSGSRAVDFLAGDKILRCEGNTELGLFRGGWARLKVSPLCQLMLCKFKDLTRLVSRTFEFLSDFGVVEATHSAAGRVGLHVAGGAIFGSESAPAAPAYTVHCWMGDNPADANSRFFLKVCDSGGASKCTLSFSITGEMAITAATKITVMAPAVEFN